jgi:hypothetical protein
LSWDIIAAAKPSASGAWATLGQSSVGDSEFDDVHGGEGRAPSNDLMSVDAGCSRAQAMTVL